METSIITELLPVIYLLFAVGVALGSVYVSWGSNRWKKIGTGHLLLVFALAVVFAPLLFGLTITAAANLYVEVNGEQGQVRRLEVPGILSKRQESDRSHDPDKAPPS
jgi:hypothetical protein